MISPAVSRQNRSNSSYGIRCRFPTFIERSSPAAIFREIVDRDIPTKPAT